jgi:putative lipoprotein
MLLGHRNSARRLRATVQRRGAQLPRALRVRAVARRVHAHAAHCQNRPCLRQLRNRSGRKLGARPGRIRRAAGSRPALAGPPPTPVRMIRALAAPLVVALSLTSGSASASDTDPWLGPDKALHFGVSMGLAAGGYAAASPWLETRGERVLAGSAFSLTLGAGKELWDLAGHGDPSWRDFTWDVLGTAAGVALAVGIDALLSHGKDASSQRTMQGLAFHF